METKDLITKEESLDPANWDDMRALGHQMVDDMLNWLQSVRDRPVWKKPSAYAVNCMKQPLPEWPSEPGSIYEDFLTQVLPYNTNNIHPRFWAWVQGTGSPMGMLADMLASGMNANLAIGNHMPVYVEKQVLDWSKELFGFPAGASGILTSGASLANLTALVVARNHFNHQIKEKGLSSQEGQLTFYGSSETHQCVNKGAEVIGIGNENFRKIPVDENYRIRIDLLEEIIREDKLEGNRPFCLIGNAGTVNTGSTDDLEALARIARREKIWFHVDGAFGAVPNILPEFHDPLRGLEMADSLSFDFHKWLYVNYDIGCVLFRDAAAHRNAFTSSVNYLLQHERGLSSGPDPFSNYGMELSRGFKALKVWMMLKENGRKKYGRLIRQNLEQAKYLATAIKARQELELMAPVPLNIICFRYRPENLDDRELNILNKEILMRLHEQGIAAPSYTLLNGRYAIRVAITNHRSRREDFDILVRETIRIGKELD
ncbi:MAG: pyridoxal phosphate-dependent decarboxylase family protein [Chitinophagales bacterium]